MNIGIVSRGDIFPPFHGAAAKIHSTAMNFSLLGHSVIFLSENRKVYHEFRHGRVVLHPFPRWLGGLLYFERPVKQLLKWFGVPDPDWFLYAPLVDVNFWMRTFYVAVKHRLHVLQAEFPGYTLPCLLTALFTRAHTALVEHNVEYLRIADSADLSPRAQRNLQWIERLLCTRVGDIITVSDNDKERLCEIGIKPDKILTIPHGVDLGSYARVDSEGIKERYGIRRDVPVLFFHGILNYPPNTEAVRSIAKEILPGLRARGIEAKALVVGRHAPSDEIQDQDLIYTGAVGDLPEHIKASDIAVVPLKGGGGIRMKIIEYFAARLPVVATPKGAEGIGVEHEEGLVREEDMEKFVDVLASLLQDHDRRTMIGDRGYRFASKLDWIDLCAGYVERFEASRPSLARKRPKTILTAHDGGRPPSAEDGALPKGPTHAEVDIIWNDTRSPYDRPDKVADLDRIFQWFDVLASAGVTRITLGGAEPMVHHEFDEILDRAAQKGFSVSIRTTTKWAKRYVAKFSRLQDLGFIIPLDIVRGDDHYESLRARRNQFYAMLRGLAFLRKRLTDSKIRIRGYITGPSARELFGIYKLAKRLEGVMELIPVRPDTPLAPCAGLEADAVTRFLEFLTRAERDGTDYTWLLRHFQADDGGDEPPFPCEGLRRSIHVDVEGNLRACSLVEGMEAVGNLGLTPLGRLWHSEEAAHQRRKLVEHRSELVPCVKCMHV